MSEKLDLTKFPEGVRHFIEQLAEVLAAMDPANISRHLGLAESAPDGLGDTEHLEVPSAYSLVAYGGPGLEAIYELARTGKSGSFWAPLALVAVALGNSTFLTTYTSPSDRYLPDGAFERLAQSIQQVCGDGALQAKAKRLLTCLVHLFVTTPDQRHRLGSLLSTGGILDKTAAEKLIVECIARTAITIDDIVLEQLESLIARDLHERNYQDFFEQHPALIDPLASRIVPRQNLGEQWKSDFVICRLDDEYIFVEIEKPSDCPMSSYPNPTAALSHAIGQVLNWFTWTEDNVSYAQSRGFTGYTQHAVLW